jgi:hypothetical protein
VLSCLSCLSSPVQSSPVQSSPVLSCPVLSCPVTCVRIHPPFPPCLLPWDYCLIKKIFSSPLKLPILCPSVPIPLTVIICSSRFTPVLASASTPRYSHTVRTQPSTQHHHQQQRPTSPFSVSLRLDSGDLGALSRTSLERLIPAFPPLQFYLPSPTLRVTAPSFYVLRSAFCVLCPASNACLDLLLRDPNLPPYLPSPPSPSSLLTLTEPPPSSYTCATGRRMLTFG